MPSKPAASYSAWGLRRITGIVLIVILALLLWKLASPSAENSGPARAKGDFGETKIASAPVTLDTPVSNAVPVFPYVPSPSGIFTPAKSHDEAGDKIPSRPFVPWVLMRGGATGASQDAARKTTSDVPLIAVDTSGARTVTLQPPAKSTALPDFSKLPASSCVSLPCGPWRASFGDRHIGVLIEDWMTGYGAANRSQSLLTVLWQRLDAASGATLGKPVVLSQWIAPTSYVSPAIQDTLPFAMSPDGERFVIGDPQFVDRLDICTSEGKRRFGFQPFGKGTPIEWADFAADGKLLVAGNGKLSAWEIGNNAAEAIYQTSGRQYNAPFLLLPDRMHLAVSRRKSFDVVDVATGSCLVRLGIDSEHVISDIAISPDGKRAAALYSGGETRWFVNHIRHSHTKANVAVWDLASGKAVHLPVKCQFFGFLAWIGPDHLCLCDGGASKVFDMQLGWATFTFGAYSIIGPRGHVFGLGKSSDGRIWRYDAGAASRPGAPLEGGDEDARYWKATTATGPRSPSEAPFFANDRTVLSIKQIPIRLDLDLGNKEWAMTHGAKILAQLQKRGYLIGSKGLVLRIQPRIIQTRFQVLTSRGHERTSHVDYDWELLDSQGRLVWSGKTSARRLPGNSKYYKDGHFDYGWKSAERATAEEFFEVGVGLVVPEEFPAHLFFSAGKYYNLPHALPWTFAEDKP